MYTNALNNTLLTITLVHTWYEESTTWEYTSLYRSRAQYTPTTPL